jgi:putative PIN family toxin of toxin-antitoxin system
VSHRAVYDTMIFFQWAALPEDRQHATIRSIYDGTIKLCMSQELLDEVRDVLSRPEVVAKNPSITPERLAHILTAILDLSEWFDQVPKLFTWSQHPDDDHIFNLAIAANAQFLVTWENRILKLANDTTPDARQSRVFAPQLKIITPKELTARAK